MIFTKIARITHRNNKFNELRAKNIENVGMQSMHMGFKRFCLNYGASSCILTFCFENLNEKLSGV
jgi:hypothetical protein